MSEPEEVEGFGSFPLLLRVPRCTSPEFNQPRLLRVQGQTEFGEILRVPVRSEEIPFGLIVESRHRYELGIGVQRDVGEIWRISGRVGLIGSTGIDVEGARAARISAPLDGSAGGDTRIELVGARHARSAIQILAGIPAPVVFTELMQ